LKKLFVLTVLVVCVSFFNSYGQEGFAVKAGLNNVSMKVDTGVFGDISDSELGFYLGGSYNFAVSEEFDIEPSVLISFVDNLNSLYVPIMAKYKINNFNIQAGPQINYLLEDLPDGEFGLDIAFGGGYQINDNWFVEARYGFQVSRGGDYGDIVDINTLTFGAGYRFN
jgi:opacity protein-like surface antigen